MLELLPDSSMTVQIQVDKVGSLSGLDGNVFPKDCDSLEYDQSLLFSQVALHVEWKMDSEFTTQTLSKKKKSKV